MEQSLGVYDEIPCPRALTRRQFSRCVDVFVPCVRLTGDGPEHKFVKLLAGFRIGNKPYHVR